MVGRTYCVLCKCRWNVNVSSYRLRKYIAILLFLTLIFICAFLTFEKSIYLNFYRGYSRTENKIFYIIPIGSKEQKSDVILNYFEGREREKLPDHWILLTVIYYDSKFKIRSIDGIGLAVLKMIEYYNGNHKLFNDKDSNFIHDSLIEILNSSSERDQSVMVKNLNEKIHDILRR